MHNKYFIELQKNYENLLYNRFINPRKTNGLSKSEISQLKKRKDMVVYLSKNLASIFNALDNSSTFDFKLYKEIFTAYAKENYGVELKNEDFDLAMAGAMNINPYIFNNGPEKFTSTKQKTKKNLLKRVLIKIKGGH